MRENGSSVGTDEQTIEGINGWVMLIILLTIAGFGVYLAVPPVGLPGFIGGILLCTVALFCFNGMLTLEPNQAAIMIFFGSYAGTLRESGFFGSIRFTEKDAYRCASTIGTRRYSRLMMSAATRLKLRQ
jgi:hypothetical protein